MESLQVLLESRDIVLMDCWFSCCLGVSFRLPSRQDPFFPFFLVVFSATFSAVAEDVSTALKPANHTS